MASSVGDACGAVLLALPFLRLWGCAVSRSPFFRPALRVCRAARVGGAVRVGRRFAAPESAGAVRFFFPCAFEAWSFYVGFCRPCGLDAAYVPCQRGGGAWVSVVVPV